MCVVVQEVCESGDGVQGSVGVIVNDWICDGGLQNAHAFQRRPASMVRLVLKRMRAGFEGVELSEVVVVEFGYHHRDLIELGALAEADDRVGALDGLGRTARSQVVIRLVHRIHWRNSRIELGLAVGAYAAVRAAADGAIHQSVEFIDGETGIRCILLEALLAHWAALAVLQLDDAFVFNAIVHVLEILVVRVCGWVHVGSAGAGVWAARTADGKVAIHWGASAGDCWESVGHRLHLPRNFDAPHSAGCYRIVAFGRGGQADVPSFLGSHRKTIFENDLVGVVGDLQLGGVPTISEGIVHDEPVLRLAVIALDLVRVVARVSSIGTFRRQRRITLLAVGISAGKAVVAAFHVVRFPHALVLAAVTAVPVADLRVVAPVHVVMAHSVADEGWVVAGPVAFFQFRTIDVVLARFIVHLILEDDAGIKGIAKHTRCLLVVFEGIALAGTREDIDDRRAGSVLGDRGPIDPLALHGDETVDAVFVGQALQERLVAHGLLVFALFFRSAALAGAILQERRGRFLLAPPGLLLVEQFVAVLEEAPHDAAPANVAVTWS
mmetsp:Transcript_15804/g.44310  ORF Transcript_15804/g.44310 Transcript_15804/m.44310 type:complete len:552 (+) Transcript_15804:879-2534(+)